MESHSRKSAEDLIEEYATGGDGGLTRDCAQAATGLSPEKAAAAAAAAFDPVQAATDADRLLAVRIAGAALDRNYESISERDFVCKFGSDVVGGSNDERKAAFARL
eukprot:3462564-Pyramimonas_sp.AAC.1